jgi:hypothetical protein
MTSGTYGRPEAPGQFAQPAHGGIRTNKKSAWALGLGIVGIPTAFFVFPPLVFSTLAIVLGTMGRNEARQDPAAGGESAGRIAVVLGVVGFVVAVAWVVLAGTVMDGG